MDFFVLVAYACSAASRTLLQRLLACLNFMLDSEDLFCWYKQKNVISKNFSSSTGSWKPWKWVKLDPILTMRDIYIHSNLNTFTKFISSRSTEFRDILPWNISQMITKTVTINTIILISYAMIWGIPLWIWWKVNRNWDNIIKICQWRENHCRTNTSIRRKKSKRAGLWQRIIVWDPSSKVNHLRKVV